MSLWVRIILYLVGLLLISCFGIWFYLFQMGGIEVIVNKQITSALKNSRNLEVTIGEVSGSIFNDITIKEISASYVDGEKRQLILHIAALTATFKLGDFLSDNFKVSNLELESPTLLLYQDSTGKLLLPQFGGSSTPDTTTVKKAPPPITLEHILIRDGSVRYFGRHDTLGIDSIQIGVSLTVDDKSISGALDLLQAELRTLEVRVGSGKNAIAWAQGSLIVQGLTLLVNEGRIGIDGVLSFKDSLTGMVTIAAADIDVSEFSKFGMGNLNGVVDVNGQVVLAGKNMRGDVSISGNFMGVAFDNLYTRCTKTGDTLRFDTLYGSVMNDCTIDGKGEILFIKPSPTYWAAMQIANFDLSQLMPNGFSSDLNGAIYLEGTSFNTRDLALDCTVELYESSFDDYPLQEASGNFVVTRDSLVFSEGFRVRYFQNEFVAAGKVTYNGTIDLSVDADLPELFRYEEQSKISHLGGRAMLNATVSGSTKNPDVEGTLTSDSLWVYELFADSCSVQFSLPQILTHTRGSVSADCFAGKAWNVDYDTLQARVHLDSGVVIFDSLRAAGPDASLFTKGSFRYDQSPQWLVCDTLGVFMFGSNFSSQDQIAVAIDSSGFQFRQIALQGSGSNISIVGTLKSNESMNLSLNLNNAAIGQWASLYDTSLHINGIVSGELFLSGSFDEPQFRLDVHVDSLIYEDFEAGTLEISARYSNQLLTLDSSRLYAPGRQLVATGYLPCDLSFRSEVIERFPDLPVNLSIYCIDSVLDVFEFLFPAVEQLDSIFVGDISVTGTAQRPVLKGSGKLIRMELKYFDLVDKIYADTVSITFEEDRILIDSIRTYVLDGKKKRYATVDGIIRVPSIDTLVYDLHVKTDREFPVSYELADRKGKIQADLRIVGPNPPTAAGEVTTITGDVTVSEMRDRTSFSEPGYGAQVFDALAGEKSWNINVAITILGNYRMQNENIDADFSGELNFIRESGRQRLLGTMEIERGKAFLFDKTFRLDPGGLVSFDGSETFNPSLDIIARTRIPSASTNAGEIREDLDLPIHIGGTLDVPEFNTVEGSQFTREDILPLLVANYYAGDSTTSSGNLEGRVANVVSAQLTQFGSRKFGVETFEINTGTSGGNIDPLKSQVTAGNSFLPNLYSYVSVGGQGLQEYGIEYRFARSMLLEGRRDELELFHLNLTLHWDF